MGVAFETQFVLYVERPFLRTESLMTLMDSRRLPAAGLMLLIGFAPPIDAVAQSESTGLDIGGLPARNFDADEGFGYGALVELYQYGQSGLRPYVWSLRPTVFLTSGGRRDFTVFSSTCRTSSHPGGA